MSFTTPPRSVDVTALFPHLAPLARTATRLHPRPGSPTVHDSSVGGPILWPADEPWPLCDGPHERGATRRVLSPDDIRLLRRTHAAIASRRHLGSPASRPTPEELATEKRILKGRPWPEGPVPLLPVAQLYACDVPLPFSPPGTDLLQVLWCPFDHPTHPRTAVFWRSAGTVTDILEAPPEPPAIKSQGYLPEPCLLAPEQITEYPAFMELDKELRQELGDPSRWDGSRPAGTQDFYENELSTSPGWKTGGWSRWGLSDPMPRHCPECGTEALPLLTVATLEWDAGSDSWAPEEERTNPTPLPLGTPPANFTLIGIARGYSLQLHACPADPTHPHIELVQ
ncbi:hypothetical protein ACOT81_23120 [Streptomyces sp. WI04-05B]|uniref:hypothetical protein n=1 Tax=Streptomyces TaxID=1883 RepID=UPI0029A5071C|nr:MULTISPECIES: hypothetical protein [unclassified Streptomyces]MDX2543041.1 hypothetical protein [Streptomyces sp. WI04-05B]MDX2584918.1 hypothetical protein [Streptomyces sp. WI04-05A]